MPKGATLAIRAACATLQPRPETGKGAVDCWIGVVTENDRRIVRLAGRLSVAQVPELMGACDADRPLPLQLDLSELVSADAPGIDALQRLRRKGATLVGIPGYIQIKLDSVNSSA